MATDPSPQPIPTPETINVLRQALNLSPQNLPLRLHLADTLLQYGYSREAEVEYRQGLAQSPNHASLQLGLAKAFQSQGKTRESLVLLESLCKAPEAPAKAFILLSKTLLRTRERALATQAYENALQIDPSVADSDLARQLDLPTHPPQPAPTALPNPPTPSFPEAFSSDPFGSDPFSDDDLLSDSLEDWEDFPSLPIPDPLPPKPTVTFQDVGGLDLLKEEIRLKIIHPLNHKDLYASYGKTVGGGILLYGPPGCGKTYLARATAGEIQAEFLSVGINDVLDMWMGNAERNLHQFFDSARSSQPCVLFFDEVDALAARRSDLRHQGGRQLINQFLAEFDNVQASNEGVLILAATNAPWHIDPAFRRPGRFDRVLFVPPPDLLAREQILQLLCRGKPLQDVDFHRIAQKTNHFSGADLQALLDLVVDEKLQQAIKTNQPKPLTTQDFLGKVKQIHPSTQEWFHTARNYALYANQGGLYDDILKYLKL